MEIALRVVSVAVGTSLVVAAVASAVKTVVIPRQASSIITRGGVRRAAPRLRPRDPRVDVVRAARPGARDLRAARHAGPARDLDQPHVPRVRRHLLGPRRRHERHGRARAERVVAVHPRLPATDHLLADDGLVHRGGDRPVPAGAADHLPAHDQRRVLAAGAGRHGARGARRRAPLGRGDGAAVLAPRAHAGAERRLGGVGALVRRRRGDPHVVLGARRSSAPRRPTTRG